jgi:hypothetical protein
MAYKSLTTLILLVFQCLSLTTWAEAQWSKVGNYELKLQIVSLSQSRWKNSEIQKNVNEASLILAQCGVKLKVMPIVIDKSFNAELMFDLEGYSSPEDTLEPNGALSLANKYPARSGVVRVFLFDQFDSSFGSITATSVPKTRITQKDQQGALNSIWLTYESERQLGFSVQDGGYQPDYNVMAHELGHLLLDDSHFSDALNYNLMHESASMLNSRLSLAQCQKVVKSELLRPLQISSQPRAEECSTSSPLSGKVLFVGEEAKSCDKAASLIKELELFQDRVSDMAAVQKMNFYFQKAGNTIQHLDRGAFEASLVATYDDYGKIVLSDKAVVRLWKHEMGHAILNAQLKLDWPWYATRLNLYREWENYILQSTILEKDISRLRMSGKDTSNAELQLNLLNEKSNVVFSKIRNLNEGFEIENLLASYHEVFSDAVVIIDEMNAKAVSEALVNPEDPQQLKATDEEKKDLINRDYSFLRDIEKWNEEEVHTKLTPSLAFYWQRLPAKKLTDSEKKYYVRQLYEVIKVEILELVKAKKFEISPVEANRRLIQKIQTIHILQ